MASTGMQHGWLLLILYGKCQRFDDCTPVIEFREKICEKLSNIRGNVTEYHNWLCRNNPKCLKLWLCGTPKVGVSPWYTMEYNVHHGNFHLYSKTECDVCTLECNVCTLECEILFLKIMELYEC